MKQNLMPMTRLFMVQCFLTMVLAVSFTDANAQAGRGGQHGQGQYGQGHQSGQDIDATIRLEQYLYQGQSIRLNSYLHPSDIRDIKSITVRAQSTQYNSSLTLMVNGQAQETMRLSPQLENQTLDVRTRRISQRDQVAIVVKGGAFVKALKIDLDDSYNPGGGHGGQWPGQDNDIETLKAQVRMSLRGTSTVQVLNTIRQHTGEQLQGLEVKKVILKASSARGNATATLVINGQKVLAPQIIDMRSDKIVFTLPRYAQNTIGRDINSLQIEIKGNVEVSMIGLKVEDSYNPRDPRNPHQGQGHGQGQGQGPRGPRH